MKTMTVFSTMINKLLNQFYLGFVTCLLLNCSIYFAAENDSRWRFQTTNNIVSIADIQGNFESFTQIMQRAKLLDKDNNWIADKTHFISIGNMIGQGPDPQKVMDLFIKLEKQALDAGGKVHVILGNHELGSINGDWDNGIDNQDYYRHWLKDKPLIIVINGKAMVHGGLSAKTGELGLAGINNRELSFAISDLDHPASYYGTARCHQYSELPILKKALADIEAKTLFIGHTTTQSREVESRFNGKVYLQDTDISDSESGGQASLVFHTSEGVKVFDEKHGLHDIAPQASRIWKPPFGMSIKELEIFLLTADVVDAKAISTGFTKPYKLTLQKDNKTIHALYKNIDTHPRIEKRVWRKDHNLADRFQFEIAAYKLDQLLKINMIPPAVIRSFNDNMGVFQYWMDETINKSEMIRNKIKYGGYCSYKSQRAVMKVFDALIHNDDRNTGNVLYDKDDWDLWLIDHSRSFPATKTLPEGMDWSDLSLADNFRKQLMNLTREDIEKELKPYLHKRQINYILKRRDKILSKVKRSYPK